MGHSKAPWKYGENGFEDDRVCSLRGTHVFSDDKVEWNEDQSNGHLIAASPQMLEVLKLCEQHMRLKHVNPDALHDAIKAVIKLAEGEV